MGGAGAAITPAESVSGMIKVIDGLAASDSGQPLSYDGTTLPW